MHLSCIFLVTNWDKYSLDIVLVCNYSNYILQFHLHENGGTNMEKHLRTRNVKLIKIGNSKGIRLPKAILQKYGFSDYLLLDETDQGLLLRKKEGDKLSWEHTYKQMAKEEENWDDFDVTLLDGLEGEDLGPEKI